MRTFSFFAIVSFCLVALVGCGKSEAPKVEEKISEAPKAPEVKQDTRKVLVCFGDSITAGYGLEAGKTYPDFLQAELDRAGFAYRVVNLGISGDTTQGALERMNSIVEFAPKITVIEIGGNDGLRGIAVHQTRDNLQQILGRVKGGGSKILLGGITLPRNYGPDYIREFENMYKVVAKNSADVFVPFILEGIWNQKGMMQGDGIHPTVEGARLLAKKMFSALQPILEK